MSELEETRVRNALREKFEDGLTSVCKRKEISAVAEELNISEQKIKVIRVIFYKLTQCCDITVITDRAHVS